MNTIEDLNDSDLKVKNGLQPMEETVEDGAPDIP